MTPEKLAHLRAIASAGGKARAARLSPERRREIARMGFAALVARRFGGNRDAAIEALCTRGRMARQIVPTAAECLKHMARCQGIPLPEEPTEEDLRRVWQLQLIPPRGTARRQEPEEPAAPQEEEEGEIPF
jgi:hypothetical protein